MIIVDAHVHIYDCFDLDKFLDAAYSNFKSEADRLGVGDKFTPVLLLAEAEGNCWFDRLREYADGRNTYKDTATQKWAFHHTGENESLTASSGNSKELLIIAGRQVETAEGLEVLALFTTASFRPDNPIVDLIKEIRKHDAIPVIPWGFGKWLGRRGSVLNNLMKIQKDLKFYLGDNSGRPSFLCLPHQFKIAKNNGIHILPGSDPLPFANEFRQVGKFGLIIHETLSIDKPGKVLKQILLNPIYNFLPYGHLERPFRFFHNQFNMLFRSFVSE